MRTRAGRQTLCVYCGKAPGVEAEHVFPRGWYPETTPATVQRVTVPSCKACNERFKKLEESVGRDLVMAMDVFAPEAAGVYATVSRAWRTDTARNERESKHREGHLRSILRESLPGPPGAEPGFAFKRIRNEQIRELEEKFIRGLHYDAGERLGPLDVGGLLVSTHTSTHMPEEARQKLSEMFATFHLFDRLAPGIYYRRQWEPDGSSLWEFKLWGSILLWAFTKPAAT